MSDYLLPELFWKIFTRLPIKSLIQCTSVCKQWRSIITSPAFISGHLTLSGENPLLLTASTTGTHDPNAFALRFDTDPDPNAFALSFDTDPPLRLSQALRFPFPTRGNGPFRVVGSVDGLILLSDDLLGYTYTMILCNPSIRKFVTLPKPRFNLDEVGEYTFMLGFGVDSATGDYKVVRLVYLLEHPGYGLKTPPLVEVFSLRDRSWRTVSSTNVDYVLLASSWGQCFIHGAVHWIGRNMSDDSDTGILLFDVGKEEFKKMALPEDENVEIPLNFSISVIGGMLSVFVNHVNPDSHGESYMNIWVKRDYFADSWTKISSLDVKKLELGVLLPLRRVCGGGDAGDWRDIQMPATKRFRLRYDGFVFSYTESLVLLDEDRAVQQVGKTLEKTQRRLS